MLQFCFIFIFIEVTFMWPLCARDLPFLKVLRDTYPGGRSTLGNHSGFSGLVLRGVDLRKDDLQGFKYRLLFRVTSNIASFEMAKARLDLNTWRAPWVT